MKLLKWVRARIQSVFRKTLNAKHRSKPTQDYIIILAIDFPLGLQRALCSLKQSINKVPAWYNSIFYSASGGSKPNGLEVSLKEMQVCMCVSISNGTLFSQPVWMTLVLWSGWVSAFWVGEENWVFRDIWRQVIWCLEPGCDAFWVAISPLEMRDDMSWHYVWFPLMLWQAGSNLTKLSEVWRPRVERTAVIKVISVKIPKLFVGFVSVAELL